MLKSIVFTLVSVIASASFAAQEYKCFGKNPYGDKINADFSVNGTTGVFQNTPVTFDPKYRSKKGDKVKFAFASPDCNDLCSGGVLVSKEVLNGAQKVFLTQEWSGEGYQSDNYACFLK